MDTQATNSDQEGISKVACNEVLTDTLPMDNQTAMAIKAPMVISPKEWCYLHNQWLYGIMQAAMGDKVHPNIPNLAKSKWSHPATMSLDMIYKSRLPQTRTRWSFSIRLSVNGI